MPSLPRALPNVKSVIVNGCADMPRGSLLMCFGDHAGRGRCDTPEYRRSYCTPGLLEADGVTWANPVVKLPARFLEAAESSTSSFFSTLPIAASLVLRTTRPCWRSIFEYRKIELKTKKVTDPACCGCGRCGVAAGMIPGLPDAWLLSGLVYDVATGRVRDRCTAAAPIRIPSIANR